MEHDGINKSKSSGPDNRGKRIVVRALLIFALLFLAFIGGREVLRPAMPKSWAEVKPGMARDEVLRIVEGKHLDMRELKGFDVFTYETEMLGASSYWQLWITYDENQKSMAPYARFVHRDFGWLSSKNP